MSNHESKPKLADKDLARSWLGQKGAEIQLQINQATAAGIERGELVELQNQLDSVYRNFSRVRNGDRNRIARFAQYETRRRAQLMVQEK